MSPWVWIVLLRGDDRAVLIVSEKLTDDDHWSMIPKNHFVIVEPSLTVRIRFIKA
jgi:glutamine amidotransferase